MKFIADLQIHSKYSRAVSPEMILEELDRWADDKGILVMGTGDFTHPAWFTELKEKLEPAEPGLFKLKPQYKRKTIKGTLAETRFMLTAETSHIYKRGGKTRRVHQLIFAPDIKTAEKLNTQLGWIGNLKSDGRPILGMDSEELVKVAVGINPDITIIPAHIWTPWFSVFGSMSGFDTLEECFGDHAKYIFAIETGLSSDPPMNWRLSKLDNISIVSNSDSHSLQKIGREANVFDCELSYKNIIDAIKNRDLKKFLYTIEFFPEEGKYHYDGHRLCGICFSPEESKQNSNNCPKCGRPLTIGVLNRVEQLADRPEGYRDPNRVPHKSLIPLDEVIAEALAVGVNTKSVEKEYENLIKAFTSEFNTLLEAPVSQIAAVCGRAEIAEAIDRLRQGRVKIKPGFDGEFGKIKIFDESERRAIQSHQRLF